MLFQIFTLTLALSLAASCPLVSSSNNCTCRTGTGKYTTGINFVACSRVYTDFELQNSMKEFRGITIDSLTVENAVLTYLPHNIFKGFDIRNIEFKNCTIMSLSDTDVAFEGLESTLVKLQFKDCDFMNSWDWSVLKNLKELSILSIVRSDLESIHDDVRGLSHLRLRVVNFSSSKISYVDDYAFANFTELRQLQLTNNAIRELKRSMLPDPAVELNMLYLNHNELESLPEDFFTNMPKLQYLDIRSNNFLTLKEETFKPIWHQLILFEADGNKLICDCRMKWVLEMPRIRQMSLNCYRPLRLKGKQVMEVQPSDMWC